MDPLPIADIQDAATRYRLDPNLVQAIVAVESRGNPWAVRYEKGWTYFYFAREHASRLYISFETEVVMQASSWGLMQVMGSVAREQGFDLELHRLASIQVGLDQGCKRLLSLFERFPTEQDVVSAYNQGSPRKTTGGMYLNQTYVDRVYLVLRDLRKLI